MEKKEKGKSREEEEEEMTWFDRRNNSLQNLCSQLRRLPGFDRTWLLMLGLLSRRMHV